MIPSNNNSSIPLSYISLHFHPLRKIASTTSLFQAKTELELRLTMYHENLFFVKPINRNDKSFRLETEYNYLRHFYPNDPRFYL